MGVGKLARRTFLGLGVAAAGGFAIGAYFYRRAPSNPVLAFRGQAVFNPYIKVEEDGAILVYVPRAEMGQGVATTLPALVAEEMDLTLADIDVRQSPTGAAYWNEAIMEAGAPYSPFEEGRMAEAARAVAQIGGRLLRIQVTGGSTSTIDAFDRMRLAGATARRSFIHAAARRWGATAETLETGGGAVRDPATGRSVSYGDLAIAAAAIEPEPPALRPRAEWRLLGRSQPRTDMEAKVTGRAIFGIDVTAPDMVFATVKMSPRFGAGAESVDMTAAEAVDGVEKIVPLETPSGSGFGVIARDTWAAFRGAEALDVTWAPASGPASSAAIAGALDEALERESGFAMGGAGDPDAAFAAAPEDEVLTASYRAPYLAHACLEPMNATARLDRGQLTLQAPTQAPTLARDACAAALGIDADAVTVETTFLGGGFGRRAEPDFAVCAALLAAETDGRPVKVTWTREEDMTHGPYRPAAAARLRARVAPGVGPAALEMRIAAPSVVRSFASRAFPGFPVMGPDRAILDGAFDQPYAIENARFEGLAVEAPPPVGFWRSVGHSHNGFFHQAFFDEIAAKAGLDPLAMRLGLTVEDRFAPARLALERVAEMSAWDSPAAPGRGKGVACCLSFGAWVAQVIEVHAPDGAEGGVRVEKVWCAADLGPVLDPSIVRAQLSGGIVFGLSAAMMQEITFADGAAVESNFPEFDAIRMGQCPEIEVDLIENAARMGGAGEPGVPPAAAALANAIFAATGRRLRETPFSREIAFL